MNIKRFLPLAFFKNNIEDSPSQGLGTFYGVFLPGILAMFGVIIFLRFGWIIGSLGLIPTLGVVTLSCLIVFLTTLSIASAATNMEVKGGGTYYMVSRALGIEIGGAIGVPLFIAQTLCISFAAMGFAESIHPFFPSVSVNHLGVIALVISMGLVYYSSAIAVKSQSIIFATILAAVISLFLGKPIPIENAEPFNENLIAPFWLGFALFFPAATGVEAGIALSGNLRSPKKSVPVGVIMVLLTAFVVYLSIPLFLWNHIPRSLMVLDPLIFQHAALFQSVVVAGIWAATLSSVLGGLLSAPRTLQALAVDHIFPSFFAKEWGQNKEPRVATILCFSIALIGILYGSIDKIAPVMTMFYLIGYTTLNLATGLEALLGNPSWRPTFKIHWIIPISGVALCLLAMFMISAGATFTAFVFVVVLYLFMRKRNLVKRWEDIWEGFLVFLSRFAIYRLADRQISSRSWRPNFLVFCDSPTQVSPLIHMTSAMSQGKGFLTLASIFPSQSVDYDRAERWKKMISSYLKGHKIEALVELCMDDSLLSGAKRLLTNYGMGSLSPNTVVLGEMKNHQVSQEYLGIIQATFLAKKNLIIVNHDTTMLNSIREIHIWWDDLSRPNSELMVLLAHMLISSKLYKHSSVHVHSIVSSESGQQQRVEYFNNFFAKGRLHFTPHIYIKDKEASPYEMMNEISRHADLVLIGMNPPQSGENLEELTTYYYSTIEQTQHIANPVFVSCLQSLDTNKILT